jgi:hypothetical protein
MLTLDDLRRLLKDRRLPIVAEATGIHANTLREVRDNPDANPTYKVLAALNSYFEQAKEVVK